MTKDERQSLILDLLMQQDSLLVTDLSEQLNVSSVTIRKDLTELEKKKKLYRNHGKAILIDPYSENKNVSEKERLYVEEKRLIDVEPTKVRTKEGMVRNGTLQFTIRPIQEAVNYKLENDLSTLPDPKRTRKRR